MLYIECNCGHWVMLCARPPRSAPLRLCVWAAALQSYGPIMRCHPFAQLGSRCSTFHLSAVQKTAFSEVFGGKKSTTSYSQHPPAALPCLGGFCPLQGMFWGYLCMPGAGLSPAGGDCGAARFSRGCFHQTAPTILLY